MQNVIKNIHIFIPNNLWSSETISCITRLQRKLEFVPKGIILEQMIQIMWKWDILIGSHIFFSECDCSTLNKLWYLEDPSSLIMMSPSMLFFSAAKLKGDIRFTQIPSNTNSPLMGGVNCKEMSCRLHSNSFEADKSNLPYPHTCIYIVSKALAGNWNIWTV